MENKERILQILKQKSIVKQKIFDNTQDVFNVLKTVLRDTAKDFNSGLSGFDPRIQLAFKDNGKFEAQLKLAGDILVFSMHSNIFEFDRNHSIWKMPFAQEDQLNTYCGIINIYNFLADSFKYNRQDDLGYLIGRIFINKDLFFMVEGKRQLGYPVKMMGKQKINRDILREIVNNSTLYVLEFDLLVPPYDNVKIASVAQMNENIENSRLQTGKRLGFIFNTDDVSSD